MKPSSPLITVYKLSLRRIQLCAWPLVLFSFAAFSQTMLTGWNRVAPPASEIPSGPVQNLSGGYATSATCRACHPGEHASWHASYHRTMTQDARPENVIPRMNGLELSLAGRLYRVEQTGDQFFVREGPAGAPPAEFGPARKMVLLTGSHHQQNFWIESGNGNALEAFPFGWLVADNRWAPLTDTFLCPPDVVQGRTQGVWNNGCINCHSTQGRPGLDANGVIKSEVSELGISCESCHGAGEEHVRRNRSPLHRYLGRLTGKSDDLIANPGRMSGPAAALACGQCHSIWAFESAADSTKWNHDGRSYRPGENSLKERFVIQPARDSGALKKASQQMSDPHTLENSFWGDGQVRVTGREYNGVAESPCFKGGDFSCQSCHQMHRTNTDRAGLKTWTDSQMQSDKLNNHACLQCHTELNNTPALIQHTHHSANSEGSSCYTCHMPHSTFGLLSALRSHQITSPTVQESVKWGRPNACNLCHLDRPLAWTAEKLKTWYNQESPALGRDEHEIAASVKWILQGDAGQRALIAWSMGWEPAQLASGRQWLAPHLANALNDPYSAIRYAAWKSLKTLPGFNDFEYDYIASDDDTFAAAARAYQHSVELRARMIVPPIFSPATLLDSQGRFIDGPFQRLLDTRNQRAVYLIE